MTLSVTYVVSRWGEPTQTFVRREAQGLAEAGVEVRAWSLKRPGPEGTDVPVLYLRPHEVCGRAVLSILRHPRLVQLLWAVVRRSRPRNIAAQLYAALAGIAMARTERSRPAHLHAHFGWVAATAAWAAGTSANLPYTVVLHAFELHREQLQDRFSSVPLQAAATVFTISERDVALVRDRHGVDAVVLRMSVPDDWVEDRQPCPGGPIVSVGSLTPKKGHDVLIAALAKLPRSVRLHVIGEGAEERALRGLAAQLDVADRVTFLGRCSEQEVRRQLRAAACFVLACRLAPDGDRDGIPVAVIEAMAVGLPVVVGAVGGVSELVEGCGFVVVPEDPVALAAAILEALDPDRGPALGVAGRERVRANWTVSSVIPLLLDHLSPTP